MDEVKIMQDCQRLGKSASIRQGQKLTGYAGEQLPGKILNLAVWKWDEVVALEEIEHALAEKIHNDANVASVVETIPQVNASVSVVLVVQPERLEYPKFDLASIAVLLYGSNDLDGNKFAAFLVFCLHHFAERALAE